MDIVIRERIVGSSKLINCHLFGRKSSTFTVLPVRQEVLETFCLLWVCGTFMSQIRLPVEHDEEVENANTLLF